LILQTGSRTDIPAFYADWFFRRVQAGFVDVRNPYNPVQVTRYRIDPEVVDALCFCTKNPTPLLGRIHLLDPFRTVFMVTITPYGRDIEPFVPEVKEVARSFGALSSYTGREAILWRYDPVLIFGRYTVDFHKRAFASLAGALAPYTDQAVVSFVDLYEKTKRNFPGIREVTQGEQEELVASFAETAGKLGMQIHLCHEEKSLVRDHVDANGCFSQAVIERAIGEKLLVPRMNFARQGCRCLLSADIGAYNTCGHGCRYCYANADAASVRENMRKHDPASTMLVGQLNPEDVVKKAVQKSWINGQLSLFDDWQGA
jgi:hypothetical protein